MCLAYVLNLRGDDIPFNPIFISYLYIGLDRAVLFIEPEKVEQPVRSYLQILGVEIRGYNDIWAFLRTREWGDGKVRNPPAFPLLIVIDPPCISTGDHLASNIICHLAYVDILSLYHRSFGH
jgi:Creatinase/Prolidase N-terminal domain